MYEHWDNFDDEALVIGDRLFYPDDELTGEEQDLIHDYVSQIEDAYEHHRHPNGQRQLPVSTGKSHSTGKSNSSSTSSTPLEPAPDDWTVQDARKALVEVLQARLNIDNEARKEGGSKIAQAYRIKTLDTKYEREQRKLDRWLKDIEARDRKALREKGGRPYGLSSDEANITLSRVMDEVLEETRRESYDFKDRIAERVRKAMTKLADEGHDEVYDGAVREAIYRDLVEGGFIQAFEPLDY